MRRARESRRVHSTDARPEIKGARILRDASPEERHEDRGWIEDFLLRSTTEAIARHDATGRLLWQSPSSHFLFGKPPAPLLPSNPGELLDAAPGELLAAASHAAYRDALERSMAEIESKGSSSCAYRVRAENGSERWLESTFSGVFDRHGELIEIRSLTRDIDRYQRPLEELAGRERQWRALLDAVPIVLMQVDAGLGIVTINRHGATLFRRPVGGLIGSDAVTLLCAGGSEEERSLRALIAQARYAETEIWSAPIESWLSVSFYPVTDEQGGLREALLRLLDITPRKRMEEKLHRSVGGLRRLAARLQSVREEERARISREIHDELGHQLTGLSLTLGWLRDRLEPGKTSLVRKVDQMLTTLDSTWGAIRRISTELRPAVLDHLGLAAAVRWQCDEFHRRSGVDLKLDVESTPADVSPEVSTAMFRILQEALTNVARHAAARSVTVSLGVADGHLGLVVADDGQGFDAASRSESVTCGLFGMEQRAVELGGQCWIESALEEGTRVIVRVPWPR